MAEPNKYAKNANIEAESKLSTVKAIGAFVLMILGLIGLAMEVFNDAGLVPKLLGKLFESYTNMLLIPVIIGVFWFFNKISASPSADSTKKTGNIPMYLMMAIGAYYLFKLITTGGF
jgi:ABC-type uncharacterized transport system permease subunit